MSDMVQCKLSKNGSVEQAWIEKKLAVAGKHVRIKRDDGSWDDGWLVEEAYTSAVLDSSVVNERSQDYKRTRKASDI